MKELLISALTEFNKWATNNAEELSENGHDVLGCVKEWERSCFIIKDDPPAKITPEQMKTFKALITKPITCRRPYTVVGSKVSLDEIESFVGTTNDVILSFPCDSCGSDSFGKAYPMKDDYSGEIVYGLNQCEQCYNEEIGTKNEL